VDHAGLRDLHDLFARILAESHDSARLPERLAECAFELFEANIGPLTQDLPALACDKGCPSCCVLRVTVTAPEIILLADYVKRIEVTAQGGAIGLKRRIELADRATRGLGEAERMALRRPCPYIVRGVCVIHPVRPLACRGHASFDRRACAQATAGRDVEVPLSASHRALRGLVQAALQSALQASGLAWGLYEMNHGLMLALGRQRRDAAWLAGRDGFAEAAIELDRTTAVR
jgi:Fe-S-cluster containining protein